MSRRMRRLKKEINENIVIGEIMGGLGNQLFIIFTTIAYALENKSKYYFRNIERVRRTYFDTPLYDNIKLFDKSLVGFKKYCEKDYTYQELPKENNLVLYGYYQSYKYFHKYREIIIENLDLLKHREILENFDGYLHFRIGDYKSLECHPVCDIEYYINCFKDIEEKDDKKNKRFIYFFEEEDRKEINTKINILKEKFNNIEFVPVDTNIEDYKQMLSMTSLKYCILANSSFSWWGAYLNDRSDKVIYHPEKWFTGSLNHYSIKDLIPLEWRRNIEKRNAYILTLDKKSERAIFSKNILENIGFDVIIFEAIKDTKPMVSHKKSMRAIYEKIIKEENNKYCYVFEDDINTLLNIDLNYIINYEKLNEDIYYLGGCYNKGELIKQEIKINDYFLHKTKGGIRGIHSLCITKKGADILKGLSDNNLNELHTDRLLENYTLTNPLYIIREDLKSPCHPGHFGIFYQDRKRFKSTLENDY